jgi:rhodanese-related sulfurtransferase
MKIGNLLFFFLLATPLSLSAQTFQFNLSAQELYQILQKSNKNKNIILLDIRTPEEFAQGHISKAININFYAPDFADMLKKLSKNKHYLVYCRSGNRTNQSLVIFQQLGFKKVQHLAKGINDWVKNGFPLVQN